MLMVSRAILSGSAPRKLRTDEALWRDEALSNKILSPVAYKDLPLDRGSPSSASLARNNSGVLERRVHQIVKSRSQEEQCGPDVEQWTSSALSAGSSRVHGSLSNHMCFVDMDKIFTHLPLGLWGFGPPYAGCLLAV